MIADRMTRPTDTILNTDRFFCDKVPNVSGDELVQRVQGRWPCSRRPGRTSTDGFAGSPKLVPAFPASVTSPCVGYARLRVMALPTFLCLAIHGQTHFPLRHAIPELTVGCSMMARLERPSSTRNTRQSPSDSDLFFWPVVSGAVASRREVLQSEKSLTTLRSCKPHPPVAHRQGGLRPHFEAGYFDVLHD